MNTLIAAFLGIFYIILFLDNMKILLLLDGIRNPVDVVAEKAHDPDAGDVIESLHRLLKGDFPPFLFDSDEGMMEIKGNKGIFYKKPAL